MTINMRQTDREYLTAEWERRLSEAETANMAEEAAWQAFKAVEGHYLAAKGAAEGAGIAWYVGDGDAARLRNVMWADRNLAAREWKYALSVAKNARFAEQAARWALYA